MKHKLAAAAVVASMIGGAGAGIALSAPGAATAQTGTTATTAAPGTTAPKQVPQFVTDALKKLVDAGTINQSQADAVSAALAAAQPPRPPGDGPGRGDHRGPNLAVVAKAIGMSEADLKTALDSGKSVADVAKAHHVDPQKVIDALVADAQTHLAADVTSGRLTQAQADAMKAQLTQRITDFVKGVRPPMGPGGPGGHRDHDGPPPADGSAPAASSATSS
jgi:hypothetical protein